MSKEAARTGEYGFKLSGTIFIQQTVPVEPGATYELSAWIRHDNPYSAGIKIELLGSDGKHIPDHHNKNAIHTSEGGEWTQITAQLTVPDIGASANLLVRSYGEGEVYFDDVAFYRLPDTE